MRHGSLFSGIGGFDLAAEWMGWENIFHCELNPFCQKILKHYWKDAISYSDITKTDFTVHRGTIDIITGGFPCQPFSQAGKRKGKEDERHLWPEMLRAIREIQPGWIVGENVPGLLNWKRGMVLSEIKADLESEGFEVFPPCILPACSKNAPHRRDRLWIIAHSHANSKRCNNGSYNREEGHFQTATIGRISQNKSEWDGRQFGISQECFNGNVTNTNGNGFDRGNAEHEINTSEGREYAQHDVEQIIAADTDLPRCKGQGKQQIAKREIGIGSNGREPLTAKSGDQGLQRSQQFRSIREPGQKSLNEQSPGSFCTNWEIFPTQSPLCGGNDGIPNRVDRIKALGNAIVPQIAFEIFKAIEQTEKQL